METEKIIRSKLEFLEKEFGLKFCHNNNRGDHFLYSNASGSFEYYEWLQFGEKTFIVTFNNESKVIDMFQESPKEISAINIKKKGIKGFFYDERDEYWTLISNIIKNEIKTTSTLFGLILSNNEKTIIKWSLTQKRSYFGNCVFFSLAGYPRSKKITVKLAEANSFFVFINFIIVFFIRSKTTHNLNEFGVFLNQSFSWNNISLYKNPVYQYNRIGMKADRAARINKNEIDSKFSAHNKGLVFLFQGFKEIMNYERINH